MVHRRRLISLIFLYALCSYGRVATDSTGNDRARTDSTSAQPAEVPESRFCNKNYGSSSVVVLLCDVANAAVSLPLVGTYVQAGLQLLDLFPSITDWVITRWEMGMFSDILSKRTAAGKVLLDAVLAPALDTFVHTDTGSFVSDVIMQRVFGFPGALVRVVTGDSGVALTDLLDKLDARMIPVVVDAVLAELANEDSRLTPEGVLQDGLRVARKLVEHMYLVLLYEAPAFQETFVATDEDMAVFQFAFGTAGGLLVLAEKALIGAQGPDAEVPFGADSYHRRRLQQHPYQFPLHHELPSHDEGPHPSDGDRTDPPRSEPFPTNSSSGGGGQGGGDIHGHGGCGARRCHRGPISTDDLSAADVLAFLPEVIRWAGWQWSNTVEPTLAALLSDSDDPLDVVNREGSAAAVAGALNGVRDALLSTEVGRAVARALDELDIVRYGSTITAETVFAAGAAALENPESFIWGVLGAANMVLMTDTVANIPTEVYARDGFLLLGGLAQSVLQAIFTDDIERPWDPPFDPCWESGELNNDDHELQVPVSPPGAFRSPPPLPSLPSGSCSRNADCPPGTSCDLTNSPACESRGGEEVCRPVGTCRNFCERNSTAMQVTHLNAGAHACNDTGTCPPGLNCLPVTGGCQYWACDPVNQELVRRQCNKMCQWEALKLVQARLSDDGQSINVTLNAPAVPITLQSCGTVFDAATVALLGGGAARCSVVGSTLVINLAPGATILPGQELSLRTVGTGLRGQLDGVTPFSGSVRVDDCTACLAPRIVLTGPSVIAPPCGSGNGGGTTQSSAPMVFDASLSTDPSGRPFVEVVWNVRSFHNGGGGLGVLMLAASRVRSMPSMRDRLLFPLSPRDISNMEDYDGYRLEVTITSWLGTSSSAIIAFNKTSTLTTPTIKISGPPVQTFQPNAGIRVAAEAVAACPGRPLNWTWTEATVPAAGVLPPGGVAGQRLFVKGPISVEESQAIVLRVSARYANDTSGVVSTADVTLIAKGSPPVARLSGPSGDVLDNTTLVFNATGSFDPDNPGAPQSLVFTWKCSGEDGAPCFMTSEAGDQTSTPGVWTIPPGILIADTWYTFTVTVRKGALQDAASIMIRPRSAAQPFPKGRLARACSMLSCMAPHSTDDPLVVSLFLDSDSRSASVSWQCDDIPALEASAQAESTAGGSVRTLTIPTAVLPSDLPSITISVSITRDGVTGVTRLNVPLNSAPYCSTNVAFPSECVSVDVQNDTAPYAVVVVRAIGWTDNSDDELKYEFGVRDSRVLGGQMRARGTSTSASLQGLRAGDVTVYVCAIDSQGARSCATRNVTVKPPPTDFNPRDALQSLDIASSAQANDRDTLLGMANQLASIFGDMSSSNSTSNTTELVAQKSTAMATAILNSLAGVQDVEQVMQAMSTLSSLAGTAAALLPDSARAVYANAAQIAVDALLSSTSVGDMQNSLNDICRLLATSLPQSSGNTSSNAGRRALAAAASSAITDARDSLLKVTTLGGKLGVALGQQATPGAGYLSAGDQGVYVAAAIMSSSAAEMGTGQAQLSAGPVASSAAGSTTGASSKEAVAITDGEPAGGRRQLRSLGQELRTAGSRRRLAATAVSGDAETQLVVNGAAATAASGATIVLQYTPSSSNAISLATTGLLDTAWTVLGGLATVSWGNSTGSTALGGDSYVLLTLPAPSYDATKVTSCLLYDISAGTITQQPGSFVSYNASSARVTCRVTALGSFFIGQSAPELSKVSSPSPLSSPSPPPPPPSTKTVFITMTMKLASASMLATKEQKDTFRSELQKALATIYQISTAAVNVNSVGSVQSDSTVQVQAELTVPASRADDGGPVAGFMTDPKSKLPADFVKQFGVVEVTVKVGKQTTAIEKDDDDDDVNVGAIVGGVVGGVAGLILIIVVLLLAIKKSRASQAVRPRREEGPVSNAPQQPTDPYQVTAVPPVDRG